MHRFYIPAGISGHSVNIDSPEIVKQLTVVLRIQSGDRILLFDGKGKDYICEIISKDKKSVQAKIIESRDGLQFSKDFTLYIALLKKENLELVIQKAVELGVSRIVPMVTDRVVKKSLSPQQFKRLESIIIEAVEQSEGSILPKLESVQSFSDAVVHLSSPSRVRLLANERKGNASIMSYRGIHAVDLFIGPEGGFTEAEQSIAISHNILSVTLGKRILRAETAAISAVSALLLP